MIELTELQKDAIREAINISMGKAASTFNSMIREHITLSVPEVNLVAHDQALHVLDIDPAKEICYVKQQFKGSYFQSDALLVFAQNESLELVKLFLGQESMVEEMTTLEREAMSEIGNIILNATIGSLSNILKDRISGTLPEFKKCTASSLFKDNTESPDDLVLLIFIDFGIESKEIQGYIVLILELDSFIDFKEQLVKNLMQ